MEIVRLMLLLVYIVSRIAKLCLGVHQESTNKEAPYRLSQEFLLGLTRGSELRMVCTCTGQYSNA